MRLARRLNQVETTVDSREDSNLKRGVSPRRVVERIERSGGEGEGDEEMLRRGGRRRGRRQNERGARTGGIPSDRESKKGPNSGL